ncbi:MAG TPA: hypothetical protein VKB34_16635, partial [Povalibacter sp.]|nr:hypothetical protein [Povalibacter sp.]
MRSVTIGLIGDQNTAVTAHRAIPVALRLAAAATDVDVAFDWVPTEQIDRVECLAGYTGLWCVPASPYRSMEGALRAIRHARENGVPYLGTCGGFQHAVLEYARNVLRWEDAEHAETAPDATRPVISLMHCPLVEEVAAVRLLPGTKIARAYGAAEALEGYHCSYGVNPAFVDALTGGPLRVTARDLSNAVRAVELDAHP